MTQKTASDTYWNRIHILGEAAVRRYSGTSLIRLKLHRSDARIFHHKEDLFPIPLQKGTRSYFHAKPYILIPRIILTVALGKQQKQRSKFGEQIGEVVDS